MKIKSKMSDIWQACEGASHLKIIAGDAYRLVESQEQVATLNFVSSREEQSLLEDMLETTKPSHSEDLELHYLLKTPFRYPPLRWGSRFGSTFEPSLFYGASNIETTLSESAYYRSIFFLSMLGDAPKNVIRTEHTLFSAQYRAENGIKLQDPPFSEYESQLTDPEIYRQTQSLGSAMRNAQVQAFQYRSSRARSSSDAICVGIFSPSAISSKIPQNETQWLCETTKDIVSFKHAANSKVHQFFVEGFLVGGKLPFAAD